MRPKLKYATSMWEPYAISLIDSLEAVQNRTAWFILASYNRTVCVTSTKIAYYFQVSYIVAEPLAFVIFIPIYHHISQLNAQLIIPPSFVSARSDHRYKVGVPFCNSNSFFLFASFIPKTSNDWNRLPASVASIVDYTLFALVKLTTSFLMFKHLCCSYCASFLYFLFPTLLSNAPATWG